ncbi:uncharacterized protein LOC130965343 [Arachis stenosperma]|uniref:uncharacterized protein LOC130965343 n=1 Tax=Arachis stenosperma TaxID=217475 RepID=UPI0025AC878B|nr:uncharacterized protein LOC130965343 [Arachis stenosperma]
MDEDIELSNQNTPTNGRPPDIDNTKENSPAPMEMEEETEDLNIRLGAASNAFRRTFKEIIRQHKPDISILLETKCSGENANNVIRQIGFNNYIWEEAQGFAGGIWICWNRVDLNISIVEFHAQFIHTKIQEDGKKEWFFTAVYTNPHYQMRRLIWSKLLDIANTMRGEWLIAGDFNEIKDSSEKKGGAAIDLNAYNRFANWINESGLIDLGFIGSRFTWRGPQWEGQKRVFKRLDRGLANNQWRTIFHDATVEVLTRRRSNHHPLLIKTERVTHIANNKPFRFEAMWTLHPEFQNCFNDSWNNQASLCSALNKLKEDLQEWNKKSFGNIFKTKRRLLNRIEGIQRSNSYGRNLYLEDLEQKLNRELDDILDKEKSFWLQKSRENWIVDGDRNTRYYHTKTIVKRGKNRIMKLKGTDGEWIEEEEELGDHIINHFKNIYQNEVMTVPFELKYYAPPDFTNDDCRRFITPPNEEEVRKAIFSIGSLKAPGSDGFPALIYKSNWDNMKGKVQEFIDMCWRNPETIRQANSTLIALVPKINNPELINQFRPIALCNVCYKVITKVLVERLKPHLNDRIATHQSNFIPGRKIQDNIIIAKELIHTMKRMKGRKQFMTIKIDFEKAYDKMG